MLREVLHGQRDRRRRHSKIFQVVELTIQDEPLHFIVEATGVVATGMIDAPDALRSAAALWPQAPPKTWLLDRGWWTRTRQGLLDPNEVRRRGD